MLLPKDWERPLGPVVLAQLVSLGAVAGTLLQYSAVYWPSDNALAVPLVLLALAALTGNAAAPRIGALLALCMALTAVPAAVSGAAKAEPAWLRPTVEAWPWMLSLVLLLANLPAADRGKRSVGAVGILAVLPALLVQGILSPWVAASVPDPFWQTARTLGHLEPVIAVGMTLGWYVTALWLLRSAGCIAAGAGIKGKWADVLPVGTAAAVIILRMQPKALFWTVLGGFLWVLIPFLNAIRKVKKR